VVSQEEQNGNKKEKGNEEENHKTLGEKEMNTKLHALFTRLIPKIPHNRTPQKKNIRNKDVRGNITQQHHRARPSRGSLT
jgi:hypothetical protein